MLHVQFIPSSTNSFRSRWILGVVALAFIAVGLGIRTGGNNTRITLGAATDLNVTGNITATGTCCASDEWFRQDIAGLYNSLDLSEKLRGIRYRWKNSEFPERTFTDGDQIGLIAQDVEKIIPEVVSTDKDGYQSVDYAKLVAVLIEAEKELKADNESQSVLIKEL